MDNALFNTIRPINPNARTVAAESAPWGTIFTVRNDAGHVVHASGNPSHCAEFVRNSDPNGDLRCYTADGSPVSLLNV